ncbi:MAG TPA: hypothetical protein PK796_02885 [Bacteroidales bacterium]|nr:hypothetical protein [Bacteroidales bacterium]
MAFVVERFFNVNAAGMAPLPNNIFPLPGVSGGIMSQSLSVRTLDSSNYAN